jgi:hypothetical protein
MGAGLSSAPVRRTVVSVSDLDVIARELDQRATQVESAGAQLVRAAAEAIWTSIAADAFRAQVDRRDRECAQVAYSLRAAAHDVRRFAGDVAAERARLRRLELEAEHLIATTARDATHLARGLVSAVGL